MRVIDADALIADCQLAQKQADRHGREFANAFYSGGGEISTEWWCVEDMIENAPTIEPKQQWIPVTERHPIDTGHYLCSFNEPNYPDILHVRLAYWTGSRWHGYAEDDINAWMPLPEPYKGGEGDGNMSL